MRLPGRARGVPAVATLGLVGQRRFHALAAMLAAIRVAGADRAEADRMGATGKAGHGGVLKGGCDQQNRTGANAM